MIKISKRLALVASLILDSDAKGVLDVGCDHALLDIYLLQNRKNIKIIASDINKNPCLKAKENVEKYHMENYIKVVQKDGISSLEDGIDTIVIAGMGTETIIFILKEGKEKLKNIDRLVICSNNKYELLRKEITKLGFYINREKVIYDDSKYYILIEFIKGYENYSNKEYKYGPKLLEQMDETFKDYIKYNIEKREEILSKIPKEKDIYKKIEKEANDYKRIIDYL